MAVRRPATDLVHLLLEDITVKEAQILVESYDQDHDPDQDDDRNFPFPSFRPGNAHPAATDFGLDGLAAFIREEFGRVKIRRKGAPRADSLLVASEAEEEQVRSSVQATVRKGQQLEARDFQTRACRSASAPPSEGDSDSNHGQDSTRFGRRGSVVRRSRPGHLYRANASSRNHACSQDASPQGYGDVLERLGALHHCGSDPEAERSDRELPQGSSCLTMQSHSTPKSALQAPSEPETASVVRCDGTVDPVEDMLEEQESKFGLQVNIQGTGSSTERPSAPDSPTSAIQDTIDHALPVHTTRTDHARSVSFAMHTNQRRRSSRAANGFLEQVSNPDDNEPISIKETRSSVTIQSLRSLPLSDIQSQPSPATTVDEIFSADELPTASSDDSDLQTETSSDHKGQTRHEKGPLSRKSRMSRKPFNECKLAPSLKGKDDIDLTCLDTVEMLYDQDDNAHDETTTNNYNSTSNHDELPKTPHVVDTDSDAKRSVVPVFEYNRIVPEQQLPANVRHSRENNQKTWTKHGLNEQDQLKSSTMGTSLSTQLTLEDFDTEQQNILEARDRAGQYPRTWNVQGIPKSPRAPPECPARSQKSGLPPEILPLVCQYLSSQEVRNLRLVNRATSSMLLPLMVRSAVVTFGNPLFESVDGSQWNPASDALPAGSILHTNGPDINRFGISFELDTIGMANAQPKKIEEEVHAWFGKYTWPVANYPHFRPLKELEDLCDGNRPLLKTALSTLTNVSELAISVDSGHGWLNGPDISDMAIFRKQAIGGSKVFGKAFPAPDTFHEFVLRQYFQWGQLNSLTACVKRLANYREYLGIRKSERKLLSRFRIREYDDFAIQNKQLEYNPHAHTGGYMSPRPPPHRTAAPTVIPIAVPPAQIGALMTPALAGGWIMPTTNNTLLAQPISAPVDSRQVHALIAAMANARYGPLGIPPPEDTTYMSRRVIMTMFNDATRRRLETMLAQRTGERHGRRNFTWRERFHLEHPPIVPQWPLLFSGYNLAAEVGGSRDFIQNEIAWPGEFPYLPGKLTETQVQWLMETAWAQRAFLSAYTNSIISNTVAFRNVHSLHIAKLSSGLISSVAQTDFWTALPSLKKLTLMIVPDWRHEHVPGDKAFERNMPVSPVEASIKLAGLLNDCVAKLENLSALRTGFVGGGEHQAGMFGRNNHVLPAPVTCDPRAWLSDHETTPDSANMLVLNHIRDLTFVNCWFSPLMLSTFVRKSRDTSLHQLTLESVSLTGIHDSQNLQPQTNDSRPFQCKFDPSEWLLETVPRHACWIQVLEKITPGKTIRDCKYDAHMIDEELEPRPEPEFKGYIEKISLKSCGYVRISGISSDKFCQNGVVEQHNQEDAMDEGLAVRRHIFAFSGAARTVSVRDLTDPRLANLVGIPDDESGGVMLGTKNPRTGTPYFGLGRLTQCVHAVEKRVLEQAWDLSFGWGDDLDRWAAVEDGWFEGGTGRFSGTLTRDDLD